MDIDSVFKIYVNQIGIAFQWQKNATLTQIIFRDTGFHIAVDEIAMFLEEVKLSIKNQPCLGCELGVDCKSMLLKTPMNRVTMAVSLNELNQITDLLEGTLFQLELQQYLQEVCKN